MNLFSKCFINYFTIHFTSYYINRFVVSQTILQFFYYLANNRLFSYYSINCFYKSSYEIFLQIILWTIYFYEKCFMLLPHKQNNPQFSFGNKLNARRESRTSVRNYRQQPTKSWRRFISKQVTHSLLTIRFPYWYTTLTCNQGKHPTT